MQKELELYEILYLIQPSFTEQETTEKTKYYESFLTDKGSQVMVKNQGKRSLAYPIKGFETATSVQFVYLGNGELIKLLNTELQRDEFILRSITTKLMDDNLSKLFA